eukprot:CAMPEP_0174886332 /NCGR_PEP_ID=MMETSP0167-20121228/1581_1 /TAXON_ID=38298 /ORGANISM="Rhodella maculata, Strain CCMP736" /LENGTH=133 /DNA_ID=CAMNT_0016122281 /DNA_START=402 /DNA_END=802 /DNA_ORIENTATION=-
MSGALQMLGSAVDTKSYIFFLAAPPPWAPRAETRLEMQGRIGPAAILLPAARAGRCLDAVRLGVLLEIVGVAEDAEAFLALVGADGVGVLVAGARGDEVFGTAGAGEGVERGVMLVEGAGVGKGAVTRGAAGS